VTFRAGDAADVPSRRRTTSRSVVEAIHDMSEPVAVLASIRRMLKPAAR
jgi:hypothetical protein